MKKDSVDSHAKGSLHRYAIEAQAISDKRKHNELTPIEQGFKNMDSDLFERIKKLFSTAAYTAINELPYTQYVKALELQQVNYGDSTLASACFNDKTCKIFVEHIAGVFEDDLQKLLSAEGDFFFLS